MSVCIDFVATNLLQWLSCNDSRFSLRLVSLHLQIKPPSFLTTGYTGKYQPAVKDV